MKKELYRKKVTNFSDYRIYKKIKEYLKEEQAGFSHNKKKLDILYDESMRRDPVIYDDALRDSINEFNTSVHQIPEPNVSKPEKNKVDKNVEMYGSNKIFDDGEFDGKDFFLCIAKGISMIDADIRDGDILIVDIMKNVSDGDIIVANIQDKMFVKRYEQNEKGKWLISENRTYEDVKIEKYMDFEVLGKVKAAVKKF